MSNIVNLEHDVNLIVKTIFKDHELHKDEREIRISDIVNYIMHSLNALVVILKKAVPKKINMNLKKCL